MANNKRLNIRDPSRGLFNQRVPRGPLGPSGKMGPVIEDALVEAVQRRNAEEEVKLRRRTPQQSCGACKAPSLG